MKGLLKFLSPFAPDQSGAVSVFYELGGITVICDAGGCTGNICGFDEPRWFYTKSALFSAGLRDMDAILGRDDRLVEKLKDAAVRLDGKFAAIIGTPVPAVIATDFRALKRMAEKRCGLPVLTVECTGTRMYDEGEEEAYLELFRTFTSAEPEKQEKTLGVIGMTPLDISHVRGHEVMKNRPEAEGYDVIYCYGMGSDLEAVKKASTAERNLVVSPAGIKSAEYLQKEFGIPYEVGYPFLKEEFCEKLQGLAGKKVLIVHQQFAANAIRKEIGKSGADTADVICGTWFMQLPQYKEPQDVTFRREEKFISYVEQENFDVIIADSMFQRALSNFKGEFIPIPHFAVSGVYEEDIW